MASFSEDVDGVLRIPAVSPSRRDYSLRSSSVKASETNSSRPQSPWRPRESPLPSPESSPFHLYESNLSGLNRSVYYSGPLPAPSKGVDRSYYSGPLPGPLPSHSPVSPCYSGTLSNPSPLPSYFSGPLSSPSPLPSYFSSPLPGFSTATIESFGFPTGSSNFPQRLLSDDALSEAPEVGSSSGSSFGEGRDAASLAEDGDGDAKSVGDETYPVNGNFAPSLSNVSARTRAQCMNGRSRNCVSQELKVGCEPSYQKVHVNRGYKSGELYGLSICSEGTCKSSSESANLVRDIVPASVVDARKHRPSGSIAWEALNDDANESINCHMSLVAIPFKWEEAPGKARQTDRNVVLRTPPHSRTSECTIKDPHSGVTEFSFEGSYRFYGGSANKLPEKVDSDRWSEDVGASDIDLVVPSSSKFLEVAPRSPKPTPTKALHSAVPFDWEEKPGKSKFEEKITSDEILTLQLPPRLASASVKRNSASALTTSSSSRRSRSMSITAGKRAQARLTKGIVSAPESRESSVGKHSCRTQESKSPQPSPSAQLSTPQDMNSRLTLATTFRSGPLDATARPSQSSCGNSSASRSGPISPFGLPQPQTAEFFCARSVRSPTSTLCGPGSVPSSSSKSSRKSSSVTYSQSSSGTSAESLEHWTDGDQASLPSTSRVPSTELDCRGSSCSESLRPHDDTETPNISEKSRRRSQSKASSSSSSSSFKPPINPIRSSQIAATVVSPRPVGFDDHLALADEFGRSSPTPALKVEDELSCTHKEELIDLEPPTRLPYKMPSPPRSPDAVAKSSSSPTRTPSEAPNCLPRFLSKSEPRTNVTPCFWVENPSFHAPVNYTEDGYRSPAYKATLELLSPSSKLSKKSDSRIARLRKSSSRLGQVHIVGSLRNSFKHLLHMCT